ncbi:MAG: TIGR00375 family protein [Methanosarcinales archaeon]|nr:MAG: TIGR00375 family protein [Methanosarcinales archaeon]
MQINVDLHIHSRYSMATSNNMKLPVIAEQAYKKGIQLVGSGDCLHPKWRGELRQLKKVDDAFRHDRTYFVPTVEVEDASRVHHLLFVPSLSKAEELYETFKKHSLNIDTDGRPTVKLTGEEIASAAKESESLIGPAHAFTPWTGVYAYYDSLSKCYGSLVSYISFVELGLSADTSYADPISDLRRLTFLTNSDAHSPWPNKFAREFTRVEVENIGFDELKKAILRTEGRRPVLNVGLFPGEGKYNESACIRCAKHYTLKEAIALSWRCKCGGRIKKGVKDRAAELADVETSSRRPPYLHTIPLSEIIALSLGYSSSNNKTVQGAWEKLITAFGSEVNVLVDVDLDKIDFVDGRITKAIKAFRDGEVIMHPGGGGKYGSIELPSASQTNKSGGQSALGDF